MSKLNILKTIQTKSDAERRDNQANHFMRIILVHHKISRQEVTEESVTKIAKEIGCSSRTVWRDIAALRKAYDKLGTNKLD
jgi:predicted DNA-binding transcriptional regulator YafY